MRPAWEQWSFLNRHSQNNKIRQGMKPTKESRRVKSYRDKAEQWRKTQPDQGNHKEACTNRNIYWTSNRE